jgi:hypothetical protein
MPSAPIVYNPETGRYEPDYSTGLPYEGAPFDPSTGNPYEASMLPPGVIPGTAENPYGYWDDAAGNWNTGQQSPTSGNIDPGQTDPSAPPPPSGSGTGTPNPYDGGSGTSSPSTFDISPSWPTLSLPRFDPGPAFQAPAPFSYDAFKAPTMEQARNEPGFQFSMDQGRKALENSAAAKGILRTGGTLKDILGWGQAAGEQNYNNVYNREANTYGMNRNNAADSYMKNYGISKDVFDTNYGQRKDKYGFDVNAAISEFAPRERAASATFDDMYRRWRDQVGSLTDIATAGASGY